MGGVLGVGAVSQDCEGPEFFPAGSGAKSWSPEVFVQNPGYRMWPLRLLRPHVRFDERDIHYANLRKSSLNRHHHIALKCRCENIQSVILTRRTIPQRLEYT